MVNSGLKMTESLIFVYKSQNFSAQYTIIHKTQYTNTIHTNTAALTPRCTERSEIIPGLLRALYLSDHTQRNLDHHDRFTILKIQS